MASPHLSAKSTSMACVSVTMSQRVPSGIVAAIGLTEHLTINLKCYDNVTPQDYSLQNLMSAIR